MERLQSLYIYQHYNSSADWSTFFDKVYSVRSPQTVPPSNVLEERDEAWLGIVNYFGDFYLLIAFYVFMNTCYGIGGLFFWFCDRYRLLHSYKIQTKRYPNNLDYITCLLNLFQNYILIIFPLIYVSYPLFTELGFTTSLPLPPLSTFCWHFVVCVIAEDVAHYFLHRLLHVGWLYTKIHKLHHQFAAPFGLAAAYAHPLEVLILGFATFLGPLLVRPHFFTFFCWVLYRQLDAVGTHCGYDLPNPTNLIPFYGGTASHDYHHKSFIWNYSSRFTFMDHIFGTYKEPV